MADLDYAGWVARAQTFTANLTGLADAEVQARTVAPPALDADLNAIQRALGMILPASLRAFFTRGTAGLECRYMFEPVEEVLDRLREVLPHEIRIYGGARLGPVSELPDLARYVGEWAENTWVAEVPDQKVIWESALRSPRWTTSVPRSRSPHRRGGSTSCVLEPRRR